MHAFPLLRSLVILRLTKKLRQVMMMPNNSVGSEESEFTKKPNSRNFSELTNYLKIYFDFAHFLCISPFRLVYVHSEDDPDSGKFRVKCFWGQKIFCGALTLLGFTWFIRDIRSSLPGLPGGGTSSMGMKNPSVYFAVMLGIIGTLLKLAVVRVLWLKQNEICEIVNYLKATSSQEGFLEVDEGKIKIWRKQNVYIFLICLAYTMIAVVNWVLGRGLSFTCYEGPLVSRWNGGWWWKNVILASKYNLFMESGYNETGVAVVEGAFTTKIDTFLGVLGSLGFYYMRELGSHCNCFLLMAILTVWTCIRQFSRQLSKTSTIPLTDLMESVPPQSNGMTIHFNNWPRIYQQYLVLKHLTKMINSVYGWNVTLFLVEGILYYAVSFDDIFVEHSKDNDVTKVIRILFYFASTCTVLFSAADVSRIITTSLKEWISVPENRKQVPVDHLYVVLNELDTNAVAIKGSNVFPVTYSLAAKLLGVTVTYFIICVQV